jgi:predicted metal-dependent HD superfamily phosphohydrolase
VNLLAALLPRFLAALPPGTDPAAAAALSEDLLARWNEPHRHYHDARHLVAMLSIVDAHAGLADDPNHVRLAVWFHDAVYDPRAGDNEEASAALAARELARLGIDAAEVVRLVRLTATHDPQPGDRDGALLADADLSILAAESDEYNAYAAAVRREYHHVPDDEFRAGRAGVLRTFLDRPTLYRVLPARAALTDRARSNIRRELGRLGGHTAPGTARACHRDR